MQNFEMDLNMRLKQRFIQTNWKDSNNFQGLKWVWMQEMTKIPFFMNFLNNIETRCRERCNWPETNQMTWNARKTLWMVLTCKKRRIESVFLGPKLGYNKTH
jgi:hypothetical protein